MAGFSRALTLTARGGVLKRLSVRRVHPRRRAQPLRHGLSNRHVHHATNEVLLVQYASAAKLGHRQPSEAS